MLSSITNRELYINPLPQYNTSRSLGSPIAQQRDRVVCNDCEKQHSYNANSTASNSGKRSLIASPSASKPYTLLPNKHSQTPALLVNEEDASRDNISVDYQSADSLELTEQDSVRRNMHFQQPSYEQPDLHTNGDKMSPIKRMQCHSEQESLENPRKLFNRTCDQDQFSNFHDNNSYVEQEQSREYLERLERVNYNFGGVIQRDFSNAAGDIVYNQIAKDSLLEKENMLPPLRSSTRAQERAEREQWNSFQASRTEETEVSKGETMYAPENIVSFTDDDVNNTFSQTLPSKRLESSESPLKVEKDVNEGNSGLPNHLVQLKGRILSDRNGAQGSNRDAIKRLDNRDEDRATITAKRTLLQNREKSIDLLTKENNQSSSSRDPASDQRGVDYKVNRKDLPLKNANTGKLRLEGQEYPIQHAMTFEAPTGDVKTVLNPVELPLQMNTTTEKKKILVEDNPEEDDDDNNVDRTQELEDDSTIKTSSRQQTSRSKENIFTKTDANRNGRSVDLGRASNQQEEATAQIIQLENECIVLVKTKRFEAALERLKECEALIKQYCEQTDPQQIYVEYLKADCYFRMKDFSRAQCTIGDTLISIERNYITKSGIEASVAQYYTTLVQILGKIYHREGDTESEEQMYARFFEHLKRLGAVLADPIRFDIDRMRYRHAELALANGHKETYIQILRVTVEEYSSTNTSSVRNRDVLLNCAFELLKANEIEVAAEGLKKYMETIKIIGTELPDHDTLIKAFDNLAAAYFQRNEYKAAAASYEESLALKIQKYGVKDERVAFGHLACGKALLLVEEYERAYRKFQSGINVLESLQGKTSLYCATTYKEMGHIKHVLKEYTVAMKDYDNALEAYTRLFGASHDLCLKLLLILIELGFITQNIPRVTDYTERLSKILDDNKSADTFIIYNELGNLFRNNKCLEDSLAFYQKALDLEKQGQVQLPNREYLYIVFCNIASSSVLLRKYGESLHYYREAAKYYERIDGGCNENLAHIYCNIAKAYKAMKKSAEGGVYIKKVDDVIHKLNQRGLGVSVKLDQEFRKIKSTKS